MIDRPTAELFVETMKANARLGPPVEYALRGRLKLRCTYLPDMSYGRYHEPLRGNEQFEFGWQVYEPENVGLDQHLPPEAQGWTGLPHEGFAVTLLMGGELAPDNTLIERFSR